MAQSDVKLAWVILLYFIVTHMCKFVPSVCQWSQFNPLTTDDAIWRRQFLAACYQLAQSVLKIGSALAERMGQGEVGGCTALADSAWRPLQLPVEKPWSMPGGPFVCLLAQMGVENAPVILYGLHFWHFRQLVSLEERSLVGGP